MKVSVEWLAGLLEGEGCFCVDKPKGRSYPTIRLNMVDRDVVERVAIAIASLSGRPPVTVFETKRPAGRQTQWKIVVRGRGAATVMRAVRPFMGERRSAKIDSILEAACVSI